MLAEKLLLLALYNPELHAVVITFSTTIAGSYYAYEGTIWGSNNIGSTAYYVYF